MRRQVTDGDQAAAGRVLVIGLDGWDNAYAERLQSVGELPALSALRHRSATFLLDPGGLKLDGLDGERFVWGLGRGASPLYNSENSAPAPYRSGQGVAASPPFFDRLQKRSV